MRWTSHRTYLDFPYRVESLSELPVRAAAAIRLHQPEPSIHSITIFPAKYYSTMHLGWLSRRWFGLGKTPRYTVVLGEQGAVIVAVDRGGRQTTRVIPYTALLDIELALMLLYAYLQFTWIDAGRAETVKIEFNAVRTEIIREQLDWLREVITAQVRDAGPRSEGELERLSATAPGKLRSYLRAALLPDEPLVTAVYQPALRHSRGWARTRTISPNRIVATTDRHLILVEEEDAEYATYGAITRFCPLDRIQSVTFESGADAVRMRVARGPHDIEIPLSPANAAVLRD